MRTRVGLVLFVSMLLTATLASTAFAEVGITTRPRSVDFGRVKVNCWKTNTCPTTVLTILNTSDESVWISGMSACGRVVGRRSCETGGSKSPGWGGWLDNDDPVGCLGELSTGELCPLLLIGTPDVRGRINGAFVVWSEAHSGIERIVLRVPVSITGT